MEQGIFRQIKEKLTGRESDVINTCQTTQQHCVADREPTGVKAIRDSFSLTSGGFNDILQTGWYDFILNFTVHHHGRSLFSTSQQGW